MKIIELSERPDLINKAVDYFWTCWGSESNRVFYKDCILNSLKKKNALPKFFLGLEDNEIVGSYALLTNDIISRQDLMPWFACLFVEEKERGKGLAEQFLNHGLHEAALKGYSHLYLSTDLIDFYERKGWEHISMGYGVGGGEIKIYEKKTSV